MNLNPFVQTILTAQLTEYVGSLLPHLAGARITDLERLSYNPVSEVYRFTLGYDEGGETHRQTFVLKLYADSPDGMDRALKERHALFSLRGAHYPVPGVLAVEVEGSPLQRPFVIMEHIDGPTLEAAFTLADDTRRAELVAMFVNLLVDLHGRGASVLTPRMSSAPSPLALVNREVYALRTWANTALLSAYLPVIEWLYARRVDVPTSIPVITHRDFVPANVVLNERGMPHVLDWAWQVGDARFDLAWTLGALRRAGLAELADQVLAEYQRVTGGEVEGLLYFEVLVATRWLMMVHMQLREHLSYGRASQHSALLMSVLQPARDALAFVALHTGLEGLPAADDLLTA